MFKIPPLVVSSHSPEETLFVCGTMLNYCVLLFKVRKHGNKIMFIYLYICYSFYIYICFHQSAECSVLRNLLLEERLWNNLNKGSKMWLLCVDTITCDSLCAYQRLYCFEICQKLVHNTVSHEYQYLFLLCRIHFRWPYFSSLLSEFKTVICSSIWLYLFLYCFKH